MRTPHQGVGARTALMRIGASRLGTLDADRRIAVRCRPEWAGGAMHRYASAISRRFGDAANPGHTEGEVAEKREMCRGEAAAA